MKFFRTVLPCSLLAISAITAGVAAWLLWPAYLEHRALERLDAAVAARDHRAFDAAVESLARMRRGQAAFDALSDVMRTANGEVRYWSIRAIGDAAIERRVVPRALVEAAADESRNVSLEATASLLRLGELAVPALLEMLASDDPRRRAGAADGLGTIGPAAAPTWPRLLALTHDSDEHVRDWALWALGKIDPQSPAVASALINALGDSSDRLRWAATNSLRNLQPASLALLTDAVKSDKRGEVRAGAACALMTLTWSKPPADVLAVLLAALQDEHAAVRAAAADSLAMFAVERQSYPSPPLRRNEFACPEAIPLLTALLADGSQRVRVSAAHALFNYGGEPAALVPVLLEGVQHVEDDCRFRAISALGDIGPPARDCVSEIVDALRDGDQDVRWVAAAALGMIRAEPERAVPALVGALKDKSATVRHFAALALVAFGAGARQALPALRQALTDATGGKDVSVDDEQRAMQNAIDEISAAENKPPGAADGEKDDR